MQTASAGGDEMESVKSYFNGTGFERWNKIYGETDEVNKVRSASTHKSRDALLTTSYIKPSHLRNSIDAGCDIHPVGEGPGCRCMIATAGACICRPPTQQEPD